MEAFQDGGVKDFWWISGVEEVFLYLFQVFRCVSDVRAVAYYSPCFGFHYVGLLKMMISTHFCSLSDANQTIAELKDHGTILKFKSTINHFLDETKQAITDHELAKHARKKEKILSLSSNSNNNNDSNTITTTNSSSQHSTPPPPGTIPDHEPLLPATQHPGVLCLVENEQLNTVIPLLDKGRNFKVTPTSKKDLIQVTEIGVQRLIAGTVQPTSEQKDAARDNHVIPCVRELSQVMSM